MEGADSSPRDPGTTSLHLAKALGGEASAWNSVVERVTPWLLAQVRERLGGSIGSVVDPEDVVQEAWSIVLPRLHELEARGGRHLPVLLRFLATTSLRIVNNHRRRSLRRGEVHLETRGSGMGGSGGNDPWAETLGVVARVAQGEAALELQRQLARLEEEPRRVLVLRGIEQHSTRSVAEQLGLTPNAVSLRYRRALEKLRGHLSRDLFEVLDPHAEGFD